MGETLGIDTVHRVLVRSRSLPKQFLCGTGKAQMTLGHCKLYESQRDEGRSCWSLSFSLDFVRDPQRMGGDEME